MVFSVAGVSCVSAVFVVALDGLLSGKRRKEKQNVDCAAD